MAEKGVVRILPINMISANAYIAASDNGAILIDCGMKKMGKKVLRALAAIGISPKDIRLIVLTHTHFDHAGCAKALKQLTQGLILCHEAEAQYLRDGYSPFPKGTMWFAKIMSFLGRVLGWWVGRYPPVAPDITISGRFDLRPFGLDGYVLPTPGHTAGSLSVVIGDRYAIVGDTLFNIFKKGVFPAYADDRGRLFKSWEGLLATGCEVFYPGHGKPFGRERILASYVRMQNLGCAAGQGSR